MQDNEKKPALRFKGFTDPWEQRKLAELTKTITTGKSVNSDEGEVSDGDIGVLKTSCVSYDRFNSSESKPVVKSEQQLVKCAVEKDSVIVSRMNTPERVGACGYVSTDFPNLFLPDRLWKLKFQDTVDTYFVYMMLVSSAYKEKITSMASGTSGSMYNIPKETFLNLQLVIPAKIDEQKQLGKILKKIDTLITLHQRKLEKLVQIRKAFAERCFLQSRKEFVMAFTKEADFEEAVVKLLIERGWKDGVLKNYTEQQLIQNWANILFENNRGIDRLNDYPLTDGEMQQIMEQVMNAKTPMKLNKFINGKSVLIKRDNPDDKLNFGKEVSLKIYDRLEIAAGLSRYQIAEQPKFPTKSKILNDRRGDLMLLINGMPVIHMELKKSGVSIKRACNQIEKYAAEGIFTGLFSLVQIFVAMNPEETVYFANPGPEGQFNPSYYFHWADFYNEPMNDWKDVTTALLSIPMAHMLVGFYTVADGSDGILKVMRSYQYYAASKISDAVSKMKKDIAARLAHKLPYQRIERTPEKQLDLLIVVDQMLTGFDSKWINTLYLDKMLQYENLIQAFSRTNRLFGDDKQFGTIKYYRRPHTMEKNIADAVKEYSGDKPFGLFVDKLDKNVEKLNALYAEIKDLFVSAGIEEFSQIPADMAERKKFADLFQSFNENLEAAKVQGFEWDKPIVIINEDADEKTELHADFDERTFKVLALRYKELFTPNPDGSENDPDDDVPYAVNSYLTTIDTADIDTDYMNSRFEKYLKIFYQEGAEAEAIHQAETELHKTFATLSQEEQKYANIFLHDIQSGAVVPQPGKTLREYIAEYIAQKQNDQIHKVAEVFGLDEKKLRAFMRANITEANINEFGRFDDLKATVDKAKAKAYFEAIEGTKLIPPKVPVKYDKLLREFIVSGGFDLKMPKES